MKRGAEKQITSDDREEEDELSEPGQGFQKADEGVLATRKIRGLPKRAAASQNPSGGTAPQPQAPPITAPKFGGFGGFGGFGSGGATTTPFNFGAPTKSTASAVPAPPVSAFAPAASSSPVTSAQPSDPPNPFAAPASSSATPNPFAVPGGSSSATPSLFASSGTSLFTPKPTSLPATSTATFSPFTAPAASPAVPNPFAAPSAPSTTSNLFGSPASSSTTSSSSTTPALSSSASSSAKAFASFLGTPPVPAPAPKPSTNGIHVQNGNVEEDAKLKAETKYYRALRGLNVSFVDAVTKTVDSDPFLDMAIIFEQYKSLRTKIKQEYDQDIKTKSSASASLDAPKASSAPTPPATAFTFGSASTTKSEQKPAPSAPSSKAAAAMPAPPTSFAGFNPPPASSSSTGPVGGFTPKFDSSNPNPFSFGPSSSSSSSAAESPKSAFTLGPTATSKSSFTFGPPSTKSSEPSAAPSIFSSNLFNPEASNADIKTTDKAPSLSSGNPFGGGFPSSDKPSASTPAKSSFGTHPSKATFTFGPTGSIGNPMGFSFGSPPKTPDEKPAASSGSFTFGPPVAKPADTNEGAADTDAASGADTPTGDAPAPLAPSGSIHDMEGEGEQDEETTYNVRTKVFKMAKRDDGTSAWVDGGVGQLKVKAHRDTNNRRLLLRNSSTGKVVINFNIHGGMNPSVAKNVVSFMGHVDGESVPFKLRVKTNEDADKLKQTLDTEIEFVKSHSD